VNGNLNPDSRKSNEFRTPLDDQDKQKTASPCPPPVRTPLAASTPRAVPPRKGSSSSVTTPIENRIHGPGDLGDVTPQQDNYSVIPEGKLIFIE